MRPTLVKSAGKAARRGVLAAIAASGILSGCGGGAPLFTSDGRPTILIQCPARGPASACTENARGMCAGAFDVIKQSTHNGSRNLLVACKAK